MTQLDMAVQATGFDRTTLPEPVLGRPGEFTVQLDAGWSSLVGVHGGYLCALAVRGAEALAPGRTVRTLSTSFLRTAQVGPASLVVREVRSGRSMSTLVADLSAWLLEQGHRACFLYTDLANPTSNRIYVEIGYERVCDAMEFSFRTA